MRKTFIPMENLKIKIYFRKYQSISFFVNLTISLLDSGVCLPNQKSNRKIKFESEHNLRPEKQKINQNYPSYIRVFTAVVDS